MMRICLRCLAAEKTHESTHIKREPIHSHHPTGSGQFGRTHLALRKNGPSLVGVSPEVAFAIKQLSSLLERASANDAVKPLWLSDWYEIVNAIDRTVAQNRLFRCFFLTT